MNHGLCKNCWWYKVKKYECYYLESSGRLNYSHGDGVCYMHTMNPCSDIEELSIVNGDGYCPDYANRKKTNRTDKMTLDDFLKKCAEKYEA